MIASWTCVCATEHSISSLNPELLIELVCVLVKCCLSAICCCGHDSHEPCFYRVLSLTQKQTEVVVGIPTTPPSTPLPTPRAAPPLTPRATPRDTPMATPMVTPRGTPPQSPRRAQTSSTSDPRAESGPKTVLVKPGDTLGILAKEHGVSVRRLQMLNSMRNENLKAGTHLIVASNDTKQGHNKGKRGKSGSRRMMCPVEESYITSGFGWRWNRFHEGVDLAADTGAPIVAADDGVVVYANWNGDYGKLLCVMHSNGTQTRYGTSHFDIE